MTPGLALALAAWSAASLPSALPPDPPLRRCERLYAVIHRVSVDRDGRITELAVEHVVDPSLGATPEEAAAHPIQMDLPPAYLAAARAFLERRSYRGGPNPF